MKTPKRESGQLALLPQRLNRQNLRHNAIQWVRKLHFLQEEQPRLIDFRPPLGFR